MHTISVIIPVYNTDDALERCMGSILAQTHTDLDVILVDDGSTDLSGILCDAYAEFDPRVRTFHTSNHGLSAARNLGLEKVFESGAELVAFVDSDDFLEPDMFENLLTVMEADSADVVQCGYWVDGFRTTIEVNQKQSSYTAEEAVAHLFDGQVTDGVWNKLYKSSIFEDLRFPEGRVFEEISTMYRVALRCKKVTCISYVGYHHVMRSGSITHTTTMQNLVDFWTAHKERRDYLVDHIPEYIDDDLMNAIEMDVMIAVSRTWRWAFGRSARERVEHQASFEEMSEYAHYVLRQVDTSRWPRYLKTSLRLAQSTSPISLAAGYVWNQAFIRLHPKRSNTRR